MRLPQHDPGLDVRLRRLDELAKQWWLLLPFGAEMVLAQRSFDEDFLIRMAYNSNAIEGSTLTLAETEIVYEGEFVPDKPGRDQVAARGIFEGSDFMDRAAEEGRPLDEGLLRDLHERCALDLQPRARGAYRTAPAVIRASRTTPVDPLRIREAMANLFFQFGLFGQDIHPLESIPWFHAALESVHPFADGNGRTGRLWMNAQLQRNGYPPISIKVDRSLEYKTALEAWQVDDSPDAFMDLFLSALEEELNRRILFLSQAPAQADPTLDSIKHGSEALAVIALDPGVTAQGLAERVGLSHRQAQRVLAALQANGYVKREGSRRNGCWVVLDRVGK